MAITPKPKRSSGSPSPVSVEALIKKGGTPAKDKKADADLTPVIVRIPNAMLARIDAALEDRPVKIPRHTWLLEAIHEKLSRDKPGQ